MKKPKRVAVILKLIEKADVLIEGFRPGVMERLGLGPEQCMAKNPRLVYGRITGWWQHGCLTQSAGHDINYIAVTGALHAIGEQSGEPISPMNLVGDFGDGGMLLALGITSALLEVRSSGKEQIVDAAMTDGMALLMAMMYGLKSQGQWQTQRRTNMLDGGAHFYRTYECSDGKWLSIGAIEPQFYVLLVECHDIVDKVL